MLRLSKKIEYALLALQYMAQRRSVCSVKEIADGYGVSFELMAKVMSTLCKRDIVQSIQGVHGGYKLKRDPSEISVKHIVDSVEADRATLMECAGDDGGCCSVELNCTIRHPLMKLQLMIDTAFDSMSVADLVKKEEKLVELELSV